MTSGGNGVCLPAIFIDGGRVHVPNLPTKSFGIKIAHALPVFGGHFKVDNGIHFHMISIGVARIIW